MTQFDGRLACAYGPAQLRLCVGCFRRHAPLLSPCRPPCAPLALPFPLPARVGLWPSAPYSVAFHAGGTRRGQERGFASRGFFAAGQGRALHLRPFCVPPLAWCGLVVGCRFFAPPPSCTQRRHTTLRGSARSALMLVALRLQLVCRPPCGARLGTQPRTRSHLHTRVNARAAARPCVHEPAARAFRPGAIPALRGRQNKKPKKAGAWQWS